MTVQNMVEVIRRRHSWVQEAEALKRISDSQREFASATHCLLQEQDIDPVDVLDGFRYLLISAPITSTTVDLVRSVKFLDANEVELDKEELDLDFYVEGRYLYFTTWDGKQLTALPANLATIRINVVYLPVSTLAIGDVLDVEPSFHSGILAHVMESLYAETGNAQMAMYYHGLYRESVLEGKKYANMDGSGLHPGVVNNDIL